MLNFSFVLQISDASKFIASKFIHHLTQSQPRNMLNIFHFSTFQPFNLSTFQPFSLSAFQPLANLPITNHQSRLLNIPSSQKSLPLTDSKFLINETLQTVTFIISVNHIAGLFIEFPAVTKVIACVFGCALFLLCSRIKNALE